MNIFKLSSLNYSDVHKERWENLKKDGVVKCVENSCDNINSYLSENMDYTKIREVQEELCNIFDYAKTAVVYNKELNEQLRDMEELNDFRKMSYNHRVTPKIGEYWYADDNQTQVGIEKLKRAEDFSDGAGMQLDTLVALCSAVKQKCVWTENGLVKDIAMESLNGRLVITNGSEFFTSDDYKTKWFLKEDKSE